MTSTSKFAGLGADVETPFKVVLRHPRTGQPIKDKAGREAHIEVLSWDSARGDAFDRETASRELERLASGRPHDDETEFARQTGRLAVLTVAWYLVDPGTREPLTVECTPANAVELYGANATRWIHKLVLPEALKTANFMTPSAVS